MSMPSSRKRFHPRSSAGFSPFHGKRRLTPFNIERSALGVGVFFIDKMSASLHQLPFNIRVER